MTCDYHTLKRISQNPFQFQSNFSVVEAKGPIKKKKNLKSSSKVSFFLPVIELDWHILAYNYGLVLACIGNNYVCMNIKSIIQWLSRLINLENKLWEKHA